MGGFTSLGLEYMSLFSKDKAKSTWFKALIGYFPCDFEAKRLHRLSGPMTWIAMMIRYDLLCEHDHKFEAWFRDSSAFDEQAQAGEVQCPYCGNDQIRKAVMAPALAKSSKDQMAEPQRQVAIDAAEKAADDMREGTDPQEAAQALMDVVTKLQKHVEETCDYVGDSFADEARAIHYGDAEERGIYGEASMQDTQELHEEGIDVMALPRLSDKKRSN